MKQKTILIVWFFFSLPFGDGWGGVFAQNLVPNPSFEDTISCPLSPSGIFPANPFSCQNWYNPCPSGTPDYFNACAPHLGGGNRNVPNNFPQLGWQYAHTGVAYIGIGTYDHDPHSYFEFVQVELTDTLITQHKYCVEFYINLVNNPQAASNNMGMYFSDIPLLYTNPWDYTGLIPQINDDTIVTDTVNWVKVSGEFIAVGGEQYITIGNFYPMDSTDTVHFQSHNYPPYDSYYYIDDVSVWDCTGSGIGVDEKEDENGIGVYPNPATSSLTLEIKGVKNKESGIKIYNVFGELVFSSVTKNKKTEIDVGNWASGVYFVEVETEKGVKRRKFVKE